MNEPEPTCCWSMRCTLCVHPHRRTDGAADVAAGIGCPPAQPSDTPRPARSDGHLQRKENIIIIPCHVL